MCFLYKLSSINIKIVAILRPLYDFAKMNQNRYFIFLSFKGTNYHGWQIQPNAVSVQQVLNSALSILLHGKIETTGAGRTDTGVHARFYAVHFDCEKTELPNSLIKSLNAILPDDIAVYDIFQVRPEVHARYSALKRTYKYTILKRKNPFLQDFAWLYPFALDVKKMNEAAKLLFDYSDFTSFSKLHTDSVTNNCKIFESEWEETFNELIFTITADRFLRNMVRAIVGTLIDIGRNKTDLKTFKNIIEQKDRSFAGMSVPAKGLELYNIEYPVNLLLPFTQ